MKLKHLMVAAAIIAAPIGAVADTVSGSASQAAAIVDTNSAAGAQIITNGQRPGAENTTYSQARIENAPSLGGLALGGGHPCAYSPATAQVSIIGGGAGFGGMKVDSACMLMVMGAAGNPEAYEAAIYMLAARDPAACKAMAASGMVAGCVKGGGSVASASTKGQNVPIKVGKCSFEDGKIRFKATSAASREAELTACKASLGF